MEKDHPPCYDDKGFSEQGVYFRLLFRYLVLLGKRLLAGETMRAFLSRWLPVILWCLVIYSFSESSWFTGANTAHVLQMILSYLPFGGGDEEGPSWLNFVIRKAAHLTEFGILAALVWRALAPKRFAYAGAWLFATVYAATDEWHQSFEPGRTATPKDVAIDSCGALLALLIVWACRCWARTKHRAVKRGV
ncbi:putative phosphotransbutyrylase [Geobacillus sp. GHH01]|nr:putative phosphotransbutyrylase [Geobacillus sp. GHH01]